MTKLVFELQIGDHFFVNLNSDLTFAHSEWEPTRTTELIVKKTIGLFLGGQNQFFTKEISIRPMSSGQRRHFKE
jgi:hypothetical protein